MLSTTIQLSSDLTRLALQLDKRPDLTRRLRQVTNVDQGETRKTLVEGTAESIQRAFTVCLTERSSNRNGIKDGKPEDKKVGIYSFANMVLKLLFTVRCGQMQHNTLNICKSLTLLVVSKNTTRKSTLHQYITTFATVITLSRQPTSHISLLSWPVPLLK
jgi:hypothetical protein